MSNLDTASVSDLIGRTALDASGDKLGTIDDVYVDDYTGQPEWLGVRTGRGGAKVSFVPVEGVSLAGDDVMVAYTKDHIKAAPHPDADGHLREAEEAELYAYYGRTMATATDTATYAQTSTVTDGDVTRGAGHDTSGPNTDDAMTRSEEELSVDKHVREAGRARLRKWIETENVTMTVPVRREVARLVTEPITDANVDRAMSGPDLSSEEHEVVLTEEVVDVDKRVVPKERVRLETEAVTEDVAVDETVRKEHIDYEGDDHPTNRRR